MTNCIQASGLASFIYWAETNAQARQIAVRQGFTLTSDIPALRRRFLTYLKNFTCNGQPASSVAGCISDGQLCSDGGGQCVNNTCVCIAGKEGQFCEVDSSSTSSSSDVTAIAVGISVPVAVVALCILLILAAALVMAAKLRGNKSDDWEIDYDELEVGEQLGAGGYGQVYKAMWKGTEVAVKLMASERVNKEMEKNFKDEVRSSALQSTLELH